LARGSNADGSINQEYCEFCFKSGVSMVYGILELFFKYFQDYMLKNNKQAKKNSIFFTGDYFNFVLFFRAG
jgi:hypothetical protein